ncbi:MAG: sialate O-acetylesterase [Pseudomonadota bacterium]
MRTLALITTLALGLLGAGKADGRVYDVWFLSGQSNMDGYGFNAELPEDLRAPMPSVRIFVGNTAFNDVAGGGVGQWVALGPGFGTGFKADGQGMTRSNRFGPELTFGRTLATLTDANVAIVKYSLGGSGLEAGYGYGSWAIDADGSNQYDHALTTIRNALAIRDIDGDGEADTLRPAGIVWMQGEADGHASEGASQRYAENLKRLMDLLRAALRYDDLPVVIGRVNDSHQGGAPTQPWIDLVHAGQAAFVEADACAAYVTETKEYAFSDDGWHYMSDDYLRMGRAFARAAHGLAERCGL